MRFGIDRRRSSLARAGRLLALAALLLCGGAASADDSAAARERERLEREIEERQEALDRLSRQEEQQQEEQQQEEEQQEPPQAEEEPAAPPKVEAEVPEVRPSAPPEEDVTVGGSRLVRSGQTAGGQVLVGGRYEVEQGAVVLGDVTVVGGRAEVAGEIHGTLVVVGGSVRLRDDARIEGDVVSIGGPIRDSGATIEGKKVQIAFGDLAGLGTVFDGGPGSWSHDDPLGFSFLELIGSLFRIGLLLVLVFLVWTLAPERAARVAARVRREPWRSGLAGLITEVVFLPILLIVVVVLLVSIIGIPLALVVPPLMVAALIAFFVIGYAGAAMAAGGIFERRFERGYTRYALLLFGILLIEGWSLAGELLLALPGPIKLMAFLALAFGFLVEYVAWTVGLGAAVGDQIEKRRLARGQPLAESRLVDHLDPQ